MHTENYKKRAGDVRRNARAELLEIRKARMARKGESLGLRALATATAKQEAVPSSPEPVAPEPPVLEDSESQSADLLNELAVRNAALAEISEPVVTGGSPQITSEDDGETLRVTEQIEPTRESFDNGKMNLTEDEVSMSPDLVDALPESEKVETAEQGAYTEVAPPDEGWKNSDLAELPGAGPGLVWMLGQCHITSLAELALQDPDDLATRLGIVGQILDVGQWVQYAKAQSKA